MRVSNPEGIFGDIVVRLSTWDLVKLVFGRELKVAGESTVIHWGVGYEATNLACPPDVAAVGSAPDARNSA